jgi:hypothetical protein
LFFLFGRSVVLRACDAPPARTTRHKAHAVRIPPYHTYRMMSYEHSCAGLAKGVTDQLRLDTLCANCPHNATEEREGCPYHRRCHTLDPRHHLMHNDPNSSVRDVWPTLNQDQANSLAASDWGQAVPPVLRALVEGMAAFSWDEACVLAACNLLPAARNELNLSTHETIDQFFTRTATVTVTASPFVYPKYEIVDGSHRVSPGYAPFMTTPGGQPAEEVSADHHPIIDGTEQTRFSVPHFTRQRGNRP